MHCICSLLLLYSFGNSTEHALSHSGLFLPPEGSPDLTFTLTHSKAGEKGRQRCSNANPQTSELPRPRHAVLGPGAQWTATAGLGAADAKPRVSRRLCNDPETKTNCTTAPAQSACSRRLGSGRSCYTELWLFTEETNQSLLSTAPQEGRFRWKSHWWVPFSAFIFFQLLPEHTEAKCVLGFFCNKPEPQSPNTKSQRLSEP